MFHLSLLALNIYGTVRDPLCREGYRTTKPIQCSYEYNYRIEERHTNTTSESFLALQSAECIWIWITYYLYTF